MSIYDKKPLQYYKVISLQLIKINEKKKSLNFAKEVQPKSVPSPVFDDCVELSIFGCNEYNQSDFDIDHLEMSMCRIFSCAVGNGCLLMTSAFFWQNSFSLCPASFCTPRSNLPVSPDISFFFPSRYILTSYFCIPAPYNERDIFSGCYF